MLKVGVIKTLDKRINSFVEGYRQNLAILGGDKEEVIYLLEKYFTNHKSEALSIYTDCSYLDNRGFFENTVYGLLSNYLSSYESLDSLINYTQADIPVTVNFIKDILKSNKPVTFLRVLEVINKFINETQRKCIFIIPEFTQLKHLFQNFSQDFSHFIILQKKCMVIVTSSSIKEAQKMLSTELNFLFGNFEKLYVRENNFLDCYFYIKELLQPIIPSSFLLSFFINILGSNLMYYDFIAQSIKRHFSEDEEKTILSTIEEALYRKNSYFFQRFIKKIELLKEMSKDYLLLIKLLFYISKGYIRKQEIISLNLGDKKVVNARLNQIYKLGYVENLGNIYKIKDELFSFWLFNVFPLYFVSPILNVSQRFAIFRKRIYGEMALFKESFGKDKIRRVSELIEAFGDDTLRLGRAKLKLPYVEKVNFVSYPEEDLTLFVGGDREIIFIGVKEDIADDGDILYFIKKASSLRGRSIKKIFISLTKFTSSAILIAKENKLITWDINEVNNLLRIYNKPILPFDQKRKKEEVQSYRNENLSAF